MINKQGIDVNMEIEQIKGLLAQLLSPTRFNHSMGVSQEAVKLAKHYGANVEKAMLAGLVHDCVKEIDFNEMVNMCALYGVELDAVSKEEKKLIHAQLGAAYAKKEFNIDDDEIYDAIKYHTTAKANMPILTKIIYVADYIEPNREFDGVEGLRRLAYIDLDAAILDGLDYTINQLIGKKRMLHQETINARNYIILKIR